MRREGTIVSYTDDELKELIARGGDWTDWARVLAMTDEEIEANADADEDSQGDWVPVDDALAIALAHLSPRLDGDILRWFVAQGPDYAHTINEVLRAYMESHEVVATAAD